MLHQKNSDLFPSRSFSVLFACGEFDCFAVICGYRRVIFASRVLGRIEYHCERSEQYHFCESKNITPSNARHISLLHFSFLNTIEVVVCLHLFRSHNSSPNGASLWGSFYFFTIHFSLFTIPFSLFPLRLPFFTLLLASKTES